MALSRTGTVELRRVRAAGSRAPVAVAALDDALSRAPHRCGEALESLRTSAATPTAGTPLRSPWWGWSMDAWVSADGGGRRDVARPTRVPGRRAGHEWWWWPGVPWHELSSLQPSAFSLQPSASSLWWFSLWWFSLPGVFARPSTWSEAWCARLAGRAWRRARRPRAFAAVALSALPHVRFGGRALRTTSAATTRPSSHQTVPPRLPPSRRPKARE